MYRIKILLSVLLVSAACYSSAQQSPNFRTNRTRHYIPILDDASFDIGVKMSGIFALDDRAPLSSNPHFEAMFNLIRLGASLEALLQGEEEPINDINLEQKFGLNGYNKTIFSFFIRYGFGESSDLEIQRHFLEFAASPGYFRQGNGGVHLHLDYQMNILKTNYGAGVQSIERAFDYEIFLGGRIGYDWSSRRSENESGFFSHLNDEIQRIAKENEFTVDQLLRLQELAESTKILLPKDVGGRALMIGPVAGAKVSKRIIGKSRLFASVEGFYDLLDLTGGNQKKENRRSQHNVAACVGFQLRIGSEGEVVSFF